LSRRKLTTPTTISCECLWNSSVSLIILKKG